MLPSTEAEVTISGFWTDATTKEVALPKRIAVMVGGPMFSANPHLAIEVGADDTAVNAPAAVLVAQKLFDLGELRERGTGKLN